MFDYLRSVTLQDLVDHQRGKEVSQLRDFRNQPVPPVALVA